MTAPTTLTIDVEQAEVQGNLAGFNQDHQRLLFVSFADTATAKAVLAELVPQLATAKDALAVNRLYKRIVPQRHASHLRIRATWVNLLLSFPGLTKLGAEGLANTRQLCHMNRCSSISYSGWQPVHFRQRRAAVIEPARFGSQKNVRSLL